MYVSSVQGFTDKRAIEAGRARNLSIQLSAVAESGWLKRKKATARTFVSTHTPAFINMSEERTDLRLKNSFTSSRGFEYGFII